MAFMTGVWNVLNMDISFLGLTFSLLDVLGFELISSVFGLFIGRIIFFNSDNV